MAKDWEHYKDAYIEKEVQSNLEWFKYIESRTESPIESIAWMHIIPVFGYFEKGDVNFQSQKVIGKYRVDFLVELHSKNKKIIIECDGHDFHEKTKNQAKRDKERDRYFVTEGYTVLRYTGSEITNSPSSILDDILKVFLDIKSEVV